MNRNEVSPFMNEAAILQADTNEIIMISFPIRSCKIPFEKETNETSTEIFLSNFPKHLFLYKNAFEQFGQFHPRTTF